MNKLVATLATAVLLSSCAPPNGPTPPDRQANAASEKPQPPALPAGVEKIRFPSLAMLDGAPLMLDGYLFRPAEPGPHPALVFVHGCSGMLTAKGAIGTGYLAWGRRLSAAGYVVLAVDSFSPRGVTNLCSPATFQNSIYRARPKDAYGALLYLQEQPSVQANRVGLIGWSQGGGTVLFSIRANESLGRPEVLPHGDFRAAVAFYPASCNPQRAEGAGWWTRWTTKIPLLVLIGDKDVWTPADPCQTLMGEAAESGSPVEVHLYPGAYHSFDAPKLAIRGHPEYMTSAGVIPITGTDPAARDDAYQRVPQFLARFMGE